jgi:hypothetical protein
MCGEFDIFGVGFLDTKMRKGTQGVAFTQE